MKRIVNAAPMVYSLGAEDLSIRQIPVEPEPIPQHCPLFMFMAPKGPAINVVSGANRALNLYGTETFNKDGKYYNHATRLMEGILAEGNTCVLRRIIPEDAGVRSNAIIYMDVAEVDLPNYVRNSLGDYVVAEGTNGYKVDDATPVVSGYKIKYIYEYVKDTEAQHFGQIKTKEGTMTNQDGSKSTMYPLFEIRAKYQGEWYNNIGFSIGSVAKADLDDRVTSVTKKLPYTLSLYTRANENTSPTTLRSLYGEPSVEFSFGGKVINPTTEARMDFGTVFKNNWFNEVDPLKTLRYNDYEQFYVYDSNIDLLLGKFIAKEKAFISDAQQTWDDGEDAASIEWFEFSTADEDLIVEEAGMINPFTCKSANSIPYFTLAISTDTPVTVEGQREINMAVNTPVFLSGGSDGTLSNEEFENGVVKLMAEYADPDSPYMDTAINVESIVYDSGFTIDTSKELINFISVRKDTAAILSTHDAQIGEKTIPLSESRAIGVALRSRAKLAPESEYFGTGVARCAIVCTTGKLGNGSTEETIAGTYTIGIKMAKMMGAGDGKWKKEQIFDNAPGNIITDLINIVPEFIPSGIKPTLWNDGLIWAQPYDRSSFHFPQLQTVYDNDTSVLNSIFTMMALCTLEKIGHASWREYTGTTTLTDGEFIDEVTAFVNRRLKDKFADMFVVIPEVVITEMDELRGYSWHLTNKLYGNNMKTVCTYSTQVYRMSDLV